MAIIVIMMTVMMIIIIIIMTIINNNHSTLGRTNGRSWRQRQSASYLALIRYFLSTLRREKEREIEIEK